MKWILLLVVLLISGCKTVETVLVVKYQDGPLCVELQAK